MISRKCPVCLNDYLADPNRLKHGRQTTCSRACSYQLRVSKTTKSQEYSCPICAAVFTRAPSQLTYVGPCYCSHVCYREGERRGVTSRGGRPRVISEEGRQAWAKSGTVNIHKALVALKDGGYAHTQTAAFKARMREITTARIASGDFNRSSSLEIIVADALSAANIEYIAQHGLRGPDGRFCACLDFYLPNLNVAIEVNGTFWHADSRFYSDRPLTPAQERTKERYAEKEKLLEDRKIRLVEVWEHDLKTDKASALADLLRRCEDKPTGG
jgi:hypothetical protein